MKLAIDINLSPAWVELFRQHGYDAVHWSTVGDPRATDRAIMAWAREEGYVVFTHDLDFSRLLALTRASGPSVFVLRALHQHGEALRAGAIVVLQAASSRARILPI